MGYRRFSDYARQRFGGKVYKVPIDAGFGCPNRDGTKGTGGCTFCRTDSFQPEYSDTAASIEEQFRTGREQFQRKNADYFMPYFQPNTNTYAPIERLETYYRSVLSFDDVVGLCIGTRPDCVSREDLELLDGLVAEGYEIWLELGLQSSDDDTLRRVNRCHDFQAYKTVAEQVVETTGLKLCPHVIFGLPGESTDRMEQTVRDAEECGLDGIKFHQLQIIEGTQLAEQYRHGELEVLRYETYRDIVGWSIDYLPDDVVVHRLMADVTGDQLLAPTWETGKHELRRWLRRTPEIACNKGY